MGIGRQVSLGNAVAAALEEGGGRVDVDCWVAQKGPRNLARSILRDGGSGIEVRGVHWHKEDRKGSEKGKTGPDAEGVGDAEVGEEIVEEKGTGCTDDVLGGKYDAKSKSAMCSREVL